MQFILESQARTSAALEELADRQIKAEARMDRFEARMDRADARMDRFDKSLDGIRKLIKTGMKLMVEIQQAERENKSALKQLSTRIDAFIASMVEGRRVATRISHGASASV